MTLNLHPVRILKFLAASVVVLTSLNLIAVYFRHFTAYEEVQEHLVRLVYFDAEQNIPTFFSSLILLSCALLMAYIVAIHREQNREVGHWIGLVMVFLFLSLDEAASLHETFIGPVRTLFETDGLFYFAWIIPYGILTLLLLGLYIRFLMRLSKRVRSLMILSGALYLLGAIVLEMYGGYHFSAHGNKRDYIFSLIATVEEILEMAGVSLFNYSLLVYINHELDGHTLTIKVANNK